MRVEAVVDDREPAPVGDAVRNHDDVAGVTVRRLEAGDIVVVGTADGPAAASDGDGDADGSLPTVGVERKTPTDYSRSAFGSHGVSLRDQLAKLTATYDHCYLLVEGNVPAMEAATGLPPEALRGSIASITARTGVPVIPCSDRERLVDVAVRLFRKHREKASEDPLPVGAVPSRNEPVQKRMYGCIDGIGPQLAGALYDAFPTVASLVAADREALLAVDGVGESRADAIREAVGRPDRSLGEWTDGLGAEGVEGQGREAAGDDPGE
jgi:ERCC4-type nuclease